MTKSATREAADEVSAPIASPVFTGNVGIGVAPESWRSTDSVLQVGGTGYIATGTSASSGQTIQVGQNNYQNGSGWVYQVTDEASRYYQNGGRHYFQVAPSGTADSAISWTTAMTIANDGDVEFGTTSSSTSINVYNDNGAKPAIVIRDIDASPTYSNRFIRFQKADGAEIGNIAANGSSVAYITSSDYRLKTDVVPMTGATDRVKLLKPCNFEWIVDGTRVDGFLAHEAQEVVPESVVGTKDAMRDEEYEVTPATDTEAAVMGTRSVPDMQGIDQSKLVPLLTATIQELIARIEALEA